MTKWERDLDRRIEALRKRIATRGKVDFSRYRNDPVGYARDILKVVWWEKQVEIAEALCRPPFRVLVKASHSVGKTNLSGGLVNWFFDTHDPGVCLTLAPTYRQVKDLIWKEVRRQRGNRGGFIGPKAPRLESSAMHFAAGITAAKADNFVGHHEASIFFIFDEAVGIEPEFWDAAETMIQGVKYHWLCIMNPTDTTSRAYMEDQSPPGRWTTIEIPATEHPNIVAELDLQEPPYPQAVRLDWLMNMLAKWSDKIDVDDRRPGDVEFPPGSGTWWRPGPLAESRLLARWPASGEGVWSDRVWGIAEQRMVPAPGERPEIGCDVARFGPDNTEFHVRAANCSLWHEWHNGWGTDETAGRLKELCREYAAWFNERQPKHSRELLPTEILCKIDDDGVGGGVVDQAGEFRFMGCSAANVAFDRDSYPNRRSELWFEVVERARRGRWSIWALPSEIKRELKRQAMAPKWKVNGCGQRVVEPKDKTRETLGRSPDGMDAVNLAFAAVSEIGVASWIG